MRFLVITQKIDKNDPVLGFFHYWLEELSKQSESVLALCLFKGEFSLPANVEVVSLGKEIGRSRLKYLYRFYSTIWRRRREYDSVFVHMNQVYVLLGGLTWRLFGKKVGLWYAHGTVSNSLRLAEKFSDFIFTSTPSGFRLPSKKVFVVGQGILTDKFKPVSGKKHGEFKLITVGRLSPVKRVEKIIEAIDLLNQGERVIKLEVIGGAETASQEEYLESLIELVRAKRLDSQVNFLGPLSNDQIVSYLRQSDLFVNMSKTGSLDKAILEAMACGLPVLTCNEAVKSIFSNEELASFYLTPENEANLALKIEEFYNMTQEARDKAGASLREIVVKNHNLQGLIDKIIKVYERN